MQRSTDRIRTTHVGSLARPPALLDLMKAAAAGKRLDPEELAEAERQAVADVVAWQRAAGLDVVSDGEQSKPGFFAYTGERLLLRHQRGSPVHDAALADMADTLFTIEAGAFSFEAANPRHGPSSRRWPRAPAGPPPGSGT